MVTVYNTFKYIHHHGYVYTLVHKQMYQIQTNLRRLEPSNVFCNIQMLIFHYIMEYFGNLSGPCPLHEQPKDEIIIRGVPIIGSADISATDMLIFTVSVIGTANKESRYKYRL